MLQNPKEHSTRITRAARASDTIEARARHLASRRTPEVLLCAAGPTYVGSGLYKLRASGLPSPFGAWDFAPYLRPEHLSLGPPVRQAWLESGSPSGFVGPCRCTLSPQGAQDSNEPSHNLTHLQTQPKVHEKP